MKLTLTNREQFRYNLHLFAEKTVQRRALRVALLVGIILNIINHPEWFDYGNFKEINYLMVLLTFLVPYLVSSWSSVLGSNKLKPGNISHIDAILKCKSCNKADFRIHIGQPVEECPNCNKWTKWYPSRIFAMMRSDNEMLKSLALFARYNPQPLFRINPEGVILGANPAAEVIFEKETLSGEDIHELIPEVREINLYKLIDEEEADELIVPCRNKYFKIIFKGVPALRNVHVYGNDITAIVLADKKIQRQAREISESIDYAWLIQKAMLPSDSFISVIFPRHFIFYKPLHTVSGDFYWVNRTGRFSIIAVADCTGHGVPGAFMSMMGNSYLSEIVMREKIVEPDEILNKMRDRLIQSLSAGDKGGGGGMYDGMDITLVVFDTSNSTVRFSGAYNPLYVVRDGELFIYEADRMPVGSHIKETTKFRVTEVPVFPGDRLVMFTDGFKDQTGGERNRKFMAKRFRELITETSALPVEEQGNELARVYNNWKGDNDQVDDVLIVGIEI
jgi:serine phosphatase RsbU (regulator of sigma subunit)